MNRRTWTLILAALILGLLALGPAGDILTALALPFTALGAMLRWLSLSGFLGNALSLMVYAGVCLIPVLAWWKSRRLAEDWLLVVLSMVLVFVLYLMVNPGLRPGAMHNEVGDVIYAGAVWSVLITWGVLKLVRSSDAILDRSIYRALRIFLLIVAAQCLVQGFGLNIAALRERIRALQEGNTMFGVNLVPTYLFFLLDAAACAMEQGLTALILYKGVKLLEALEADPYGEGCVTAGREAGSWCRRTLVAVSAASLALNLGQVFFAGLLHDVSVTVRIPASALAVSFGMMALTRLLTEGKALKDDNDLFI